MPLFLTVYIIDRINSVADRDKTNFLAMEVFLNEVAGEEKLTAYTQIFHYNTVNLCRSNICQHRFERWMQKSWSYCNSGRYKMADGKFMLHRPLLNN